MYADRRRFFVAMNEAIATIASSRRITMGRLAQTDGLTDVQQEILAAVRDFVDNEIIPNAQRQACR